MANCNMQPDHTIILGAKTLKKARRNSRYGFDFRSEQPDLSSADIFLPRLDIKLEDVCVALDWNVSCLNTANVNDNQVKDLLVKLVPSMVVYSGFGGQIVSKDLLGLGYPFLHIHSGWLPKYRGSTTIYYSLLQDGICAASAFFLDEGIDTGSLVRRKKYPMPDFETEIDHLYDGAIRADLLIEVLSSLKNKKKVELQKKICDANIPASHFYVIHPVLKHLAKLRCKKSE